MKGLDLLTRSLRTIGALESGEVPSADEAADGLVSMNDMMDAFQVERMMIFTININEFALIPGQQVYTLGTGGNFAMTRPARIDRMSIVNLTNPAQPLELPIDMLSDAEWQQVPVKVITSTLPLYVYDDGSFPLRNLSFYPVPQITVNTRIYSWAPLNSFPDLTTDITFPPGYSEMLRYQLAVRIAPEYGMEASASVIAQAAASKAKIKRINAPDVRSAIDAALIDPNGGYYDWRSDTPVGLPLL